MGSPWYVRQLRNLGAQQCRFTCLPFFPVSPAAFGDDEASLLGQAGLSLPSPSTLPLAGKPP